jgi:hypothetical protein
MNLPSLQTFPRNFPYPMQYDVFRTYVQTRTLTKCVKLTTLLFPNMLTHTASEL